MKQEDELRRNLLTKQHLARGQPSRDLLTVVDDLVGLHATGSTSPYLQLLARVPGSAVPTWIVRSMTIGRSPACGA